MNKMIFWSVLLALTVLSLGTTACGSESIPEWITVEGVETIGAERVSAAISAAIEWNGAYDCGRSIVIRPYTEGEVELFADGSREVTLEVAGPGYIELGAEGDVRNIVLHSMTHACVPDKPNMFSEPFAFSEGWILGYHGLSILVQLHDGTETAFRKIEEGVCERNASFLGSYSVTSEAYFRVGTLTKEYFPKGSNADQYAKMNDVHGFTATFFGVDRNAITLDHVVQLMAIYNSAYHGQ